MKGKIFNKIEIQAIIAGNKTMFRDVCKKQDGIFLSGENGSISWHKDLPKFQVGQEIFVKEPFNIFCSQLVYKFSYKKNDRVFWMPASRMKQEHSRQTLRIKSVKVERLQDISEEDAIAEGIEQVDIPIFMHLKSYTKAWKWYKKDNFGIYCARKSFGSFWNLTHKKPKEEWEANPWVFVYGFEIINN